MRSFFDRSPEAIPIVTAEAIRVRVPFRYPIVTSVGRWTYRESWIVRLFDTAGAVGLGEAALDYDAGDERTADLARRVRKTVDDLRNGLHTSTIDDLTAAGAPGLAVVCALQSALMDLGLVGPPEGASPGGVAADSGGGGAPARSRARAAKAGSRARGAPRSVPVNAAIGFSGATETVVAARAAADLGFATLKIKVGPERDWKELRDRVVAVRAAVGPAVRLRLDANGAWDVRTARERIAGVAPFGIEFVEQPVPARDPRDLAAVRKGSLVPIAADESVASFEAARGLLRAGAADVLVVKPARVGGPLAAWDIAALAAAEGVPVVISTLFETGVGLGAALAVAAALPSIAPGMKDYAHGLATADLLESDLLAARPQIVRGRMVVPDGRGLGIVLDDAALRYYTVEKVGGHG